MLGAKESLTLDGAIARAKLIARGEDRPACVVKVRAGGRLALVGRAPGSEGWLYYQASSGRTAGGLLARYNDFAGRTGTDVAATIARVVHPDGRVEAAGELVERFQAGLLEGRADGRS